MQSRGLNAVYSRADMTSRMSVVVNIILGTTVRMTGLLCGYHTDTLFIGKIIHLVFM